MLSMITHYRPLLWILRQNTPEFYTFTDHTCLSKPKVAYISLGLSHIKTMAKSNDLEQKDDLFHSIIMTEDLAWKAGYDDGLEMGKKKAFDEGYRLGAQKGMGIGKEVGFYAGYAAYVSNILKDEASKARIINVCNAIELLANQFMDVDPLDESLTDNLSKIQAKFKQLTSLLRVQTEYVTVLGDETKGSSF